MKKRVITLLLAISMLLTGVLSGCGKQVENSPAATTPLPALNIVVKDVIPGAYVGVSYDVEALVVPEEGVEYSFRANYIDPEKGTEKKLSVKNGKLTPKVEAEITLTINATKGEQTATKEIKIPMGLVADAIDSMLASDGAAGGDIQGVQKSITKDTTYFKAEGSVSALSVSFSNPSAANDGTELFDLSHYSLTGYYADRTWDNAAVVFWVYNPMESDVEFKLCGYDSVNKKAYFWGDEDNTQVQIAKAGQWTKVAFSLYQMGICQVLFSSPDKSQLDSLRVLARYAGSGVCNLYVDGIDVVKAESIEGLETGYVKSPLPEGDFSDLLNSCRVYTTNTSMILSTTTEGNGTKDAYQFGTSVALGYPVMLLDFDQVTDISGFDYLKFDIFASKAYPHVTAGVRYINVEGEIKFAGASYDYYRETWRTLYVNLDYLKSADLTKVVGVYFGVHMDSRFVAGEFNNVIFDNVSLYTYGADQPDLPAATVEDHDLISGAFYTTNTKPGTSGVCKVAADEKGNSRSNSALVFWTNNACGYPNVVATFRFEEEQDWSDKSMLSVDTHQDGAHYWMGFTIIALDANGNEVTYYFRHDTVLTHWMTNSFPFSWFQFRDLEGEPAKPEDLSRVIGLSISVDLAVNVTSEVGCAYFDNITVS